MRAISCQATNRQGQIIDDSPRLDKRQKPLERVKTSSCSAFRTKLRKSLLGHFQALPEAFLQHGKARPAQHRNKQPKKSTVSMPEPGIDAGKAPRRWADHLFGRLLRNIQTNPSRVLSSSALAEPAVPHASPSARQPAAWRKRRATSLGSVQHQPRDV